jgi:hypothetical protein
VHQIAHTRIRGRSREVSVVPQSAYVEAAFDPSERSMPARAKTCRRNSLASRRVRVDDVSWRIGKCRIPITANPDTERRHWGIHRE